MLLVHQAIAIIISPVNRRLKMFFFLLILSCIAGAETIHVPSGQPTIQAGIDAAAHGDTVLVEPGQYFENINFNGKNIVLGSRYIVTGDTSFVSRTIIDGNQNGTVVIFESGEDSTTVLCGFTITNGKYIDDENRKRFQDGGGIICKNSSPKFKNLYVTKNNSRGEGGGIWCRNSNASFYDIFIFNNLCGGLHGAGGVICEGGNPRFFNIRIHDNSGTGGSGGIYCLATERVVMENMEISNNYSVHSTGGLRFSGTGVLSDSFVVENITQAIIRNITISGNHPFNEGITTDGGLHIYNTDLVMVNSIIYSNLDIEFTVENRTATIAYSNIEGGISGVVTNGASTIRWLPGNIDSDPLFINPLCGDYRLQKGSPCIDAGTAFFEVDGKVVVDLPPGSYKDSAPDMGMYESDYSDTSVEEKERPAPVKTLSVRPNPFNPSTSITFDIPKAGRVELSVYNAAGQKVADLLSGFYEAGSRTVTWNGSGHASGLYVCRLEAGGMVSFEKMLLLK